MALTTELYIGSYDDTHISPPIPGPDVTMANAGLVTETLVPVDLGLANLLFEQDGTDSDAVLAKLLFEDGTDSDATSNKDMDSDFELDGAFGLGVDDDPFFLLGDALFAEMCREIGLSGVSISKQHPEFC